MKKGNLLFAALILVLFQACKKDNSLESPYLGKNYFPTNIGHELVYDVELITKSSFTGLWDSSKFRSGS